LEKLKSYIISTGITVYDPMCIDEEVLISENLGVKNNSKLEIYKKDRWSLMHEKIYITEPELDNYSDGCITIDELPNKSISRLAKSQTPQRDFFWIKNSDCLICWRPFIESKHHAGVLSEIQYAIHNNVPVIAFSPLEDLEEHPSPFASMVNLIVNEDDFYYQIRKFINPNTFDMTKVEKPPKYCDHTSVGIVIYNEKNEILLIERGTFPFGMAVPAGHIDEHASYEEAAIAEAKEEVGLDIYDLELIAEGRRDNPCRRVNGTWHYWKIFKAKAKGEVVLSEREAKRAEWCNQARLIELGMVKEKNKTIEPVWLDWFSKLNILPKIT
jgi:ADP-ribose pyrophosphatase YjhB (NUDIX family)